MVSELFGLSSAGCSVFISVDGKASTDGVRGALGAFHSQQ
jgi:hypothetical protein